MAEEEDWSRLEAGESLDCAVACQSMPEIDTQDDVAWTALLAACNVHGDAGMQQAGGVKEIVTSWNMVRTKVTSGLIDALFGHTKRTYVLAKSCLDEGFLSFITKRYTEVYGREHESDKIMKFFVMSCYMEYYLGYTVDHLAVQHARKLMIDKIKACLRCSKKSARSNILSRRGKTLSPSFSYTPLKKRARHCWRMSVPKRPRSTEMHEQKRIQDLLSEINVAKNRIEEAKDRAARIASMGNVLEVIRGKPLGDAFDANIKEKECPICFQNFTTEGWYTLGSCGHEYHMRCILLHALCACSCVMCKMEIPREFYLTVGQERNMPSPEEAD